MTAANAILNDTTVCNPGVQISAHRGDSSRFRENTLPAIRSAVAGGAEFVEIDVRLTSDGAVIVLHDATLDRLWERNAEIAQTTFDEVCQLGDPDDRPPLLSEVLALVEGSASTLLIDMDDPSFAEPAFMVTANSYAVVAWCGDLDGMRTIRALSASARIWMPWNETVAPTAADLAELTPERVNSDALTMTASMVRTIHTLGSAVAVWTIDDELTMRWAIDIGVDTITTNQLSRLRRVLAEEQSTDAAADSRVGPHRDPHGDDDIDEALVVARGLAAWATDFARSADPGLITTKMNPADLVTNVDIEIERHVRKIIDHHFPQHGFVGEEMGGAAEAGVPCWYLDPVDGTTNFANRLPWNAFSLALVVDDTPLVAVIADPWRAELFEAVRGRGANLNGQPLWIGATTETHSSPIRVDPLAGRVVSTELAAHVPWPGMLQLLTALGERFCTMRVMGSGTLTLVGVAAGRGVGAVIGEFGAVDHVAAALIVKEAGGVVWDASGRPTLFPASGGILVATVESAPELFPLWRKACADAALVDD